MQVLMYMLLWPARLFVGRPLLAYVVAVLLASLLVYAIRQSRTFRSGTYLLLVLTTVCWVLFGQNEERVNRYQLIHNDFLMRVDLVFFWPPLLLLTILSLWLGLRALDSTAPATGDHGDADDAPVSPPLA